MDAGKIPHPMPAALPPRAASEALAPAQDTVTLGGALDPAVEQAAVSRLLRRGGAPDAPRVLWERPIDDARKNPRGGGFLPAAPVIARDGSVYVGTNKGVLIAFDGAGTEQWRYDLGSPSPCNDPVIGYDGALVLTNEHDTRLRCLEPAGTLRFDVEMPEPARANPDVDSDGRIFVIGDKQLHAFNPDGTKAWSTDNPGHFNAFFLRPDGGALQLGVSPRVDDPPVIQCVDRDGKVKWTYQYEGKAGGVPATGPAGETVVTDGSHLRILAADGHVEVDRVLGDPRPDGPLVDPQGRVFVPGSNGVSAFDLQGNTLWTAPLSAPTGRHPMIGPDGTLYVPTTDDRVHAFTPSSGAPRWSPASVSGAGNARVVVAPDNTVFACDVSTGVTIIDDHGLVRGKLSGGLTTGANEAAGGGLAVCDFDAVRVIAPAGWLDNLQPPPQSAPRTPGDIHRVGDWIIIDGVAVPVRKPQSF